MKRFILLFVLVCSACQPAKGSSNPTPAARLPTYFPTIVGFTTQAVPSHTHRAVLRPSRTPTAVPSTPTVTPSPDSPRGTATPIPTLASYASYTIESLRSRAYGGGDITIVKTLEEADSFTRYLIRYPSDGLTIYGFANIPKGEGPFPVIIAIHGYVNPAAYQTVDYTASALDVITRSGYIVIHPNLRNYPPSDDGDNLFRVGMAVDVLNLIALVKAGSGPAKLFATAAPEEIGLWAHSMGGNIALRVLTVSPDVKAAVLFAAMSGDEQKNSELFARDSSDPIYQEELAAPPAVFQQISPMYYYRYITAPIQLHHGGVDRVIPLAWAEETCNALAKVHVQVECLYYPTEEHTFRSRVADQVFGALSRFYATYLLP